MPFPGCYQIVNKVNLLKFNGSQPGLKIYIFLKVQSESLATVLNFKNKGAILSYGRVVKTCSTQ